jgi:hypothetical protein
MSISFHCSNNINSAKRAEFCYKVTQSNINVAVIHPHTYKMQTYKTVIYLSSKDISYNNIKGKPGKVK